MEHPRKPIGSSENLFNTSYQEQRTEAWRQSAATTASSNAHTPRQGTPPPQRPSSPDHKTRPSSGMAVTRANDWMAGGRDLYWESIQKRPRSGHIPGWKEGLPDNMRRPKSAVAARTLNRIPPSSCERSPRSQSTISGAHQNMTSIFEDDEFNVVNTEYTFPFGL
ncbi:hypothetical protein MAR_038443 [Mya arenaria]|uniref:Uncharacterized protein n=1 Tax=Mya arenaria TaxID=6604 RepID=A0ABY7FUD2_MYAAR|nr:hypothetical protein MAR_038443 [Mya arenaria]